MLTGELDAASAAFEVGDEKPFKQPELLHRVRQSLDAFPIVDTHDVPGRLTKITGHCSCGTHSLRLIV
jgi:hypothetical protein